MNKIISYSLVICLLIIGGSFFYYYIIFLPDNQRTTGENHRVEKEQNRISLNKCLDKAEELWVKQAEALSRYSSKSTSSGSAQAVIEANTKVDKDLQQNKDNCFKEFPQ